MIPNPSNYALMKYLINSAHELGEKEEELDRKEERLTGSYHAIREDLEKFGEEISFSHKWFIVAGTLIFILGFLIGDLFF